MLSAPVHILGFLPDWSWIERPVCLLPIAIKIRMVNSQFHCITKFEQELSICCAVPKL